MTASEHVSIARQMWRMYLRNKDKQNGMWARYSARVHINHARAKARAV